MMKTNFVQKVCFVAVASLAVFSGCSKDDEDDKDDKDDKDDVTETAAFTVQLNSTAAALNLETTSLAAKLGGVDLIAQCAGDQPPGTCLDDGLAPDPDIWVNAGCSGDIAQCTTSNTEFFELIDPTAANTVLNSQGRSIDIGTFVKVRIYLLNNDAGDALECNGEASAVRPGTPINVNLPSALTVAAGESVTVTLNYDPSAVDCADEGTISAVFSAMTATVVKN